VRGLKKKKVEMKSSFRNCIDSKQIDLYLKGKLLRLNYYIFVYLITSRIESPKITLKFS